MIPFLVITYWFSYFMPAYEKGFELWTLERVYGKKSDNVKVYKSVMNKEGWVTPSLDLSDTAWELQDSVRRLMQSRRVLFDHWLKKKDSDRP
jgi:hypothetical protein